MFIEIDVNCLLTNAYERNHGLSNWSIENISYCRVSWNIDPVLLFFTIMAWNSFNDSINQYIRFKASKPVLIGVFEGNVYEICSQVSRIPGTNLLIIANLGYTKKLCNGICHVFVREDGSLSWVTRLMKHRPVSADMPKFHLTSPPLSIFPTLFNSSPPGQNGHYFTGDSFMCIFVNEKFCIWISLKFVPKGPIDNNRAMIIAWHRIGDKPLSEPMQTIFTDAYMRH